jgi:hypothetical protein
MPRRLKYLIGAICLIAITSSVFILASAWVRHNRAAGLFDAKKEKNSLSPHFFAQGNQVFRFSMIFGYPGFQQSICDNQSHRPEFPA